MFGVLSWHRLRVVGVRLWHSKRENMPMWLCASTATATATAATVSALYVSVTSHEATMDSNDTHTTSNSTHTNDDGFTEG